MNAYWKLTLAQLKLFARNRTVIFWTTLFPLFLMAMLGLFLGGGTTTSISMTWIDDDQTPLSAEMKRHFVESESIDLIEQDSLDAALAEIEAGDVSFVVYIPQGLQQDIAEDGQRISIDIYYDEVNQAIAELGFAFIDQAIDGMNRELVNYEETIYTEQRGVQSLDLTYLDFLVPGIAALMILSSNLNGVTAQIASWRERGVLRRLQSTPLSAGTFIASQITARLALNGSQAVLVLLVGVFLLGAQMNGSWLLLLGYLILGTLVFMSIGFIIASLAKSPEHAAPIAGFISFPMFFLGGIFFPITNMPSFLHPIVYAIPISHLTEVLRQVMNVGAHAGDLFSSSLILGVWFVGCFGIASWIFRWE